MWFLIPKIHNKLIKFKSFHSDKALQIVRDIATKNVYVVEGTLSKMPEITEDGPVNISEDDFKISLRRVS